MEESKMADLEKKSKEDLEFDIYWEKREKKILLICSAICCGIGIIIAVITGIKEGFEGDHFFVGIWFGTGIGGAIGYIRGLPHAFKETMKTEGFVESLKSTILGLLLWLVIFALAGPVSLLIRILRMNFRIKKFEKQLSALG
jgi:hypothetical protein